MYLTLLNLHSLFRWVALIGLLYAAFLAAKGFLGKGVFTPTHNRVRHWSATLIHVQFAIGMLLYFQVPRVDHFFKTIHPVLMFIAVLLVTFGSSLTKRKPTDQEKFKTWTIFYLIALVILFLAIPWPFMPWAPRPYFRTF